ncbi:MAG TPA: 3-methyl-2-oxobutanoate hydroxymethyltransferase [Candidatus Ornithomonoglobus merdipullorum]|uniref:3-methyl-2-oxobutanoate hydroxymethyltransferase n=1 Tax=Candidatus Ornithomonoglobus merdipullorum TaxID=2840895 RepID=A0A9D1MD33_9FIRM|nr:3-methyl-2-oxobutanoate hydroxymethyltransferase [Candidatus Ornithomonoglobus merdipullorum]
MKKVTAADFAAMKESGEKISMVTAYDYSTARLVDGSGIDSILVGDSLGMVMLGYEDTVSVTMEDMIHHCAAVTRGTERALVICDMPFMSYQTSVYDAVKNAGRIMKEGRAGAVKLEGGTDFAEHIEAIVKASIPVCAHIGMTPQSVNAFGGFKVQGRSVEAAKRVIEDAVEVEKAGAFAVVLECVPARLAEYISGILTIPTIGIGAGAGCGGQVLVYQDMLSMYSDFTPKFVKKFADVGSVMRGAFEDYNRAVKDGSFPAAEHGFKINDEVLAAVTGRDGSEL